SRLFTRRAGGGQPAVALPMSATPNPTDNAMRPFLARVLFALIFGVLPWSYTAHAAKPAVNHPPSVSLIAPANGTSFPAGSNITLTATASDSDGSIAKVEFYRGGTSLIGTATS